MKSIPEIKILRLTTGEDIIASCIFDEETDNVLIDNPMKIGLSRTLSAKSALMILAPWLPIELLEVDSTYLNQNDIIAVMVPRKSTAEYYSNLVEKYQSMEDDANEFGEDDFFGQEKESEEDKESVEENDYDEMMQIEDMILNTNIQKKTTYH